MMTYDEYLDYICPPDDYEDFVPEDDFIATQLDFIELLHRANRPAHALACVTELYEMFPHGGHPALMECIDNWYYRIEANYPELFDQPPVTLGV